MPCEEIRAKLQEYLDGGLSPGEALAVEAHLARCAACREELTLLCQVDEALAAWPVLAE
ncbi:MAG: zf-HC2 domain-containing protein, partial [Anaerolineae bacterium]